MQYPVRPQIPNPYQIAGQAVSQLGGQVREYGKERDQLAENFRLMMEKRAATELEKQRLTAEQDLKLAAEKRQQSEFETKQKEAERKAALLKEIQGADMADPAVQLRLKQALASGEIDPKAYEALNPKKPELPTKIQEFEYAKKNGFTGTFNDFVNPPKPAGGDKPTRGQVVTDANGNLIIVDPVTGQSRPVSAPNGTPVLGKGATSLPDAEAKAQSSLLVLEQMVGRGSPGSPDYKPPHPGLASAVGMKGASQLWGAMDEPISGTDAANFKALVNQVTGTAFLQAFESLKGGGAITQVEGDKATQAITRMSTSQSEAEFIKAANELKDVIRSGLQRAKTRSGIQVAPQPGPTQGGAVGRFKVRVKQ